MQWERNLLGLFDQLKMLHALYHQTSISACESCSLPGQNEIITSNPGSNLMTVLFTSSLCLWWSWLICRTACILYGPFHMKALNASLAIKHPRDRGSWLSSSDWPPLFPLSVLLVVFLPTVLLLCLLCHLVPVCICFSGPQTYAVHTQASQWWH